ncbi:hypothetical protein SAMN05421548_12565 [Paraburkholderia lycopersici]|uniref:Uncharacterized protein n=1 Tax=Paraburkholderia lycopersici TaxID=416944 RepID=A0A1G6XM32_9BURK|nr:hypothetical protein SAMN05421548_12565 [Paraburkholderia lycopersici]
MDVRGSAVRQYTAQRDGVRQCVVVDGLVELPRRYSNALCRAIVAYAAKRKR